jgi:hypothetical protein
MGTKKTANKEHSESYPKSREKVEKSKLRWMEYAEDYLRELRLKRQCQKQVRAKKAHLLHSSQELYRTSPWHIA